MVVIIPSINAPTLEEVQNKIKQVEPYVQWCHLDVTDGIFSKHLTWHNPADLPLLDTKLKVEVHLMVENPEKHIGQWLARPVRSPMPKASADAKGRLTSNGVNPIKRVIVHLEAAKDIDFIIQKCREAGVEIGLAIRPDTFWGKLKPWLKKIDLIHILAVSPGPSGQKMAEDTYDKLKHLREACPDCQIEIDGGVGPENIDKLKQAGADILVIGSAIFNNPDPAKELAELVRKAGV